MCLTQLLASAIIAGAQTSPATPAPALPPAATDTILAGHPALRRLSPRIGTDTSEVFAVRSGERKLVSTFVQTVSRTKRGYMIAQRSESPRGVTIDSIEVAEGTFAPLSHVEIAPKYRQRITYDGLRLTGTKTDSTGEHVIDVTRTRPSLDNSSGAIVMDLLPLAPGYTATIIGYDISGVERTATLRVVGTDQVQRAGKSVEAWRIDIDFGQWTVTRWIERSTARELQWKMARGEMEMWGVSR